MQDRGRRHRAPKCHPDRPHYARGLCQACYMQLYRKGCTADVMPPMVTQEPRMADCHEDRRHYALGLCHDCYMLVYNEGRKEARARTKAPKPQRMARCHPDRPWYYWGLCEQCYHDGYGRRDELMEKWNKLHGIE
jgi:hypothetical protein